jgi:hypothetical protein
LKVRPSEVDGHVLAFDNSDFLQALAECGGKVRGLVGRSGAEETDSWDRLPLRPSREWARSRRSGKERGEIASSHWASFREVTQTLSA